MSKIPRLFEKKPPPSGCTALDGGFFKKTRRQETILPEQGKNGGCRTALPASLSYHMPPTKSTENRKSVTMEKSEVLQSDLHKMQAGNPGRVRILKKTVKKCLFCKHL